MTTKRLLIQACSGRKLTAVGGSLPAGELYDGVAFRVIKKFLRENSVCQQTPAILILSAEYGLISSEEVIAFYDRRMTPERAAVLRNSVLTQWNEFHSKGHKFDSVFVNCGRDYLPTLEAIDLTIFARVEFAAGGIGVRNGQLKRWLNRQ